MKGGRVSGCVFFQPHESSPSFCPLGVGSSPSTLVQCTKVHTSVVDSFLFLFNSKKKNGTLDINTAARLSIIDGQIARMFLIKIHLSHFPFVLSSMIIYNYSEKCVENVSVGLFHPWRMQQS